MLLTHTINAENFAKATFAGDANVCGCELRSDSARFVSSTDARLRLLPTRRQSAAAMCTPKGGGLQANIMGGHQWRPCSPSSHGRVVSQVGIGRVS